MSDTLTTNEIAESFGTDGKTLRKFLRSYLPKDQQPGQGSRYSFDEDDVKELKPAFDAWSKNKAKKADASADEIDDAPAKDKKSRKKAEPKPAPEIEDADDEIDDLEPSSEDLEDIADLELD